MPEQVNVPGIGKTNRMWVIGGLAAVAGIVGYAYFRRATAPEPPGEGEYTAGDQWSPDAFQGASAPGGETYDPNDVTSTFPMAQTNAEWTQRVVDWLVNVAQAAPEFAAATIGKYLSGNPLTASEKTLVQTGIAAVGNPPAGALPIMSGPEPTTRPTVQWKIHHTTMTTTLGNLASIYKVTLSKFKWYNPQFAGKPPTYVVKKGTRILVPRSIAA